jgi:hypothetical protein
VKITAQVYAMSWQAPQETTVAVEVTLERTDQRSIEGYQLDSTVYRGLLAALTDDTIAGPMAAEFDREVKVYRRDDPEVAGTPLPDGIEGYPLGNGGATAGNSGPGW